ncbi:MAG TPA: ATP-binding protein [Steroidobacteraceae bacterium]|jgi:nitrogen fixation/metabolism regulation signal transduction histidine kinase|nr:ATP-binding protein [Steroidobacteraceae bacterium]
MGFSRFRAGIALRTAALSVTIIAIAQMLVRTQWYVPIALCVAAALVQVTLLMRFATQSGREVARFLDAISFDDTSQSFSGLAGDSAHRELGAAMAHVLDLLRTGRAEREAQSRYLQTLIAHVPVALISVDEIGRVQLLNMAARRLFETALSQVAQFTQFGEAFAVGIDSLRPGTSALIKMERGSGTLQLKAAATDVALGGLRRRLISLQNIENEMSAQEMAAWQTVVRVMAHEVMNSLTPVSSLAATARDLVRDVLSQTSADDARITALTDARDALETVARRSEGLLHFVQNHRRLTKPLATQMQIATIQRVFARIHRLLATELAANDIQMTMSVEPQTLELAADADLLDQALINLVRNAIEALSDVSAGQIALSARRDSGGRVVIAVADNGPGISSDQRDRIFVPFFTTKRQGSGVGLTLVRQVATAHGASVDAAQTPGGGATISLRF